MEALYFSRRACSTMCLLICLISFAAQPALSQEAPAALPLGEVSLDSLDAFRDPPANWNIVGRVATSPTSEGTSRTEAGQGILFNQPTEDARGNLFTEWEHGDLELELEFLMPKGSNSGVYLQGRYEVQLFDSWGKKAPQHSDAGGIYERWDETRPEGEQGYEGRPPRVNASRAPGLWQHYKILFEAPRFDTRGEKVSNARFVRVEHNGVVIHENVEVTGPTRAAAFEDEQPMGPLMFQGDHGPVAFRNIRYKRYTGDRITLQNIRYRYAEGAFDAPPDTSAINPQQSGAVDSLTARMAQSTDQFALVFTGEMTIPTPGSYLWVTQARGGVRLVIDGQEAISYGGESAQNNTQVNEVRLEGGTYPFMLSYFKNGREWQDASLRVEYEGPGIPRQSLTPTASAPPTGPPEPIIVEVEREPVVLRSFIEHGGEKRTHAVSVGDTTGTHYALDLANGALLRVWKGEFVDATEMWHERGEPQLAQPLGSVLGLSGRPVLLQTAEGGTAPPDSALPYEYVGYRLDEAGRPTFRYRLDGLEIEDRLRPADQGRALARELTLKTEDAAPEAGRYVVHLAEADRIERQEDGSYRIGDNQYYLEVGEAGGEQPVLREQGGMQTLLLPVRLQDGQTTLNYTILW